MTEEIMPREDRMGKILTFIGGCLAGVIGVFTVAAMSELSSSTAQSDDSQTGGEQDETLTMSDSSSNQGN
jgi:hypothetical protein